MNTLTPLRPGLHLQLYRGDTGASRSQITLPRCISLSIVMTGDVALRLQGRALRIGESAGAARAILTATSETVAVERNKPGGRLDHIGILAEPNWLEQSGIGDRAGSIRRCGRELQLRAWNPSARMLVTASQMLGAQSHAPLDRLRLESQTLDLLAEGLTAHAPLAQKAPTHMARCMQLVRERIEADSSEPLSLALIALEFGMGVDTLQRHFRAAFGVSLFEHLRGYRLDVARRLIEDGMRVSSAAYAVGYGAPANFSTAFRRRFGYPPSRHLASR